MTLPKTVIGIDARFMLRPLRGMPLYVLRLCEYLPYHRDFHFVFFINKGYQHNDPPQVYEKRIEKILKEHDNVTFVNRDDAAEVMWEQRYLPRLVKQHKVALLHMPANRTCFLAKVPTVVTLHDAMEYLYLLDEKFPVRYRDSLRLALYNLRQRAYVTATYRYGFRRAARVITVSDHSAADLRGFLKLPTERVAAVHHGVDPEYLLEAPLARKERGHVLMLGGDSHQKNPTTALRAWSLVSPELRRRHPLKIVGFCGQSESAIPRTLRETGLQDEVEVLSWVEQGTVVESFRRAALFLFPSRYEGFGFPLLQAMASGTPVISTNRASIPEVLGGVGFKYDPDDHAGMASGIELLLSDQSAWHEQSAAGSLRARDFTWERSADAHLQLYRELLQ